MGKELSMDRGQCLHSRDHTSLEEVIAIIQSYNDRPVSNHWGPETAGDRLSFLAGFPIRLLSGFP